jgi:hypothetical protein
MRKVALRLMIRGMRLSTLLLAVAVLLAGCGGGNGSQAKASPTSRASPQETPSLDVSPSPTSDASPSAPATASPPPPPVTGSFGVLVTRPAGATYAISLIGVDGRVAASTQATSPTQVACPNAGANVPLPISTTNSRVYFMDAQGVVRFLNPAGATGQATTVPAPGARTRSMFAVSPNDQRIAVAVATFSSSGASTSLYVEDLSGGTNHVVIFSENDSYTLWPMGWHGTSELVLAKVPACTQGGGLGCCGPVELHVVNPANAVRRLTLGGPSCVISGPPSAGGATCQTITGVDKVYSWTGALLRAYAVNAFGIYLSPSGQYLALSTYPGHTTVEGARTLNMDVCGWIDDTHIIAGGDAQSQPRIGNISTGVIVPVPALGECAGRLPGGI